MPGAVYWNHNSAYHRWILRYARAVGGHAVDVGAGDGLLAERLAPVVTRVTAVEPDPSARLALADRVGGRTDVSVRPEPFLDLDLPSASVDVLTFVATLHHLPLVPALTRARELLRPGGLLLVVGLSADHTRRDWALSAAAWPLCRGLSRLHHEQSPEVVVAEPSESLSEIGAVARDLLPGVRIKRGLYYRYLLRWTRPV